VCLDVLAPVEVTVVGRDQADAGALGEADRPLARDPFLGAAVVLDLEEEVVVPENLAQLARRLLRPRPTPRR